MILFKTKKFFLSIMAFSTITELFPSDIDEFFTFSPFTNIPQSALFPELNDHLASINNMEIYSSPRLEEVKDFFTESKSSKNNIDKDLITENLTPLLFNQMLNTAPDFSLPKPQKVNVQNTKKRKKDDEVDVGPTEMSELVFSSQQEWSGEKKQKKEHHNSKKTEGIKKSSINSKSRLLTKGKKNKITSPKIARTIFWNKDLDNIIRTQKGEGSSNKEIADIINRKYDLTYKYNNVRDRWRDIGGEKRNTIRWNPELDNILKTERKKGADFEDIADLINEKYNLECTHRSVSGRWARIK